MLFGRAALMEVDCSNGGESRTAIKCPKALLCEKAVADAVRMAAVAHEIV